MNISYSLYELESDASLNAVSNGKTREGALLRVQFEEGMTGYADCHSWPELGDLPLQRQLDLLSSREMTPITRCALESAREDAKARFSGKPILKQGGIPRSHFLISDIHRSNAEQLKKLTAQSFTHVKIKMGRQVKEEGEKLVSLFQDSPLKVRLDFNETLNPAVFRSFLKQIEAVKEQIDFIEDPFPFHCDQWISIQQEGWRLACDRQAPLAVEHPESASVLIIKPAIQSIEPWKKIKRQTCIVTSYLGHPLGQAAAAYAASEIDPSGNFVHGLLSHHAYLPTSFSSQLNWEGPTFTFPPGNGFSFCQELERLSWRALK